MFCTATLATPARFVEVTFTIEHRYMTVCGFTRDARTAGVATRNIRMVLSDRSIKQAIEAGTIVIEPYSPRDVQPASVDVHLANKILVFRNSTLPYIDPVSYTHLTLPTPPYV